MTKRTLVQQHELIRNRLFPYEGVVDEVLGQHDLSEGEIHEVKLRMAESDYTCPWFAKHAYNQAHQEASAFIKLRNQKAEATCDEEPAATRMP